MVELDSHKELARRLYEEVFGRGNLEAADQIMAADVISHGPGSPPLVGTDQIKRQAMLMRAAMPDFEAVLNDQFGEGDRVVSRWTGRGTHTGPLTLPNARLEATGQPISFDEIRIDRFAGGRIVESWFIPDRFTLWQQFGLVKM